MAPLPPLVDAAWEGYVAFMKSGPRYQEHIAPEKTTTVGDQVISYRTLGLDKNSATYTSIAGTQQPSPDLVTLKYTVETKGSAPTDGSGYPLFLAMHGGGETSAGDNDGEWLNMTQCYRGSIAQGVYIALRGIGNTWDLHFTQAGYVLIERLIENFILFGNVNPNQVYLLGFSAGGDGVYRMAPQLAQRFSAANVGGGHPGSVKFDNLANLPICLQVGEYDSKYGRCYAVAGSAIAIDTLKSNYPNDPSIYQKEIFIHQPDQPALLSVSDPDDQYVLRHWQWEAYYAFMTLDQYPTRGWLRVVNDYKNWYTNYNTIVPDHDTHFADTHAINWMTTHAGNRPRPQRVVWDLRDGDNYNPAVFSNISGRGMDGKGRSQNYWLDIGRYTRDYVGASIEASIDRGTNTVNVVRAQNYLRVLLVPDMVADPRKPVTVKVGGQTLTTQVRWDDPLVVAETLIRNDPSLIFTGEIVLVQRQGSDGKWSIATGLSARL